MGKTLYNRFGPSRSRNFTTEYVDQGGIDGRPVLGNCFFVNSNTGSDTTGYGQTPDAPFASLGYAVSQCTANNGDAIYLAPNHSETFTTAGDCSINVAGVTVIGNGVGNTRSKFQISTATTAGLVVGAAGFHLENVTYDCNGVDAATIPFAVQAADCTLKNVLFGLGTASAQPTCAIRTTAAANNLTLDNCTFLGSSTVAGTTAAIILVGGDGITIKDCVIQGFFTSSVGGIQGITTATTDLLIKDCVIQNYTASATKAIVLLTGSTGSIVNNRCTILSGDASVAFTGDAIAFAGNYVATSLGPTISVLV